MALSITHSTVVAVADDGTSPVGSDEWNDDHVVTGTPDGVREILTANRTYYVRTDGNDANTGLVNDAAGAWLTLQHAVFYVAENIDIAGFKVTISVGAGTFAGFGYATLTGGGILGIDGAGAASTTIEAGPADNVYNFGECISILQLVGPTLLYVNNVTLDATSTYSAFAAYKPNWFFQVGNANTTSALDVDIIVPDGGTAFSAYNQGFLTLEASSGGGAINISFAGATAYDIFDTSGFVYILATAPIVITETPDWDFAFAYIGENVWAKITNVSGAATGPRFSIQPTGYLLTETNDLTYLPGDADGTIAVGGQYDSILGGVRELLAADRTYYVRTDGSDSNTGLVDSAGGAFLTLQKAYDVIASTLDLGGFDVTVSVADGTYSAGVNVTQPWTGGGSVRYTGDLTTPANCVISATTDCFGFSSSFVGSFYIGGFKLTSSAGNGINQLAASLIQIDGKMEYGACGNYAQIAAGTPGGYVVILDDYSITGDCFAHFYSYGTSSLSIFATTITLTGSPAFTSFAYCAYNAVIDLNITSFSGAALTGSSQYDVQGNGTIVTYGVTLPGDVAGSATTGGVFI
jgi:hypothetical protein